MSDALPGLCLRDARETWVEWNARLHEVCRLQRVTAATLADDGRGVLLQPGPGPRLVVEVWPVESDNPEVKAAARMKTAGSRYGSRLRAVLAGGVVMLTFPAEDSSASLVPASGGRPPFGFRVEAGQLVPDPREGPVVRHVFQAEDAGCQDAGQVGALVVHAFPWLTERTTWNTPRERTRSVARILAKRTELEPLL